MEVDKEGLWPALGYRIWLLEAPHKKATNAVPAANHHCIPGCMVMAAAGPLTEEAMKALASGESLHGQLWVGQCWDACKAGACRQKALGQLSPT